MLGLIVKSRLLIAFAAASCLAAQERPNILLIMADDMGYSDLGCYGSEIETPNIDRLADEGVRFTNFYNTGRCCPSRASLMTGLYSHQAGVGHMLGDWKPPAYTDGLRRDAATLAESLGLGGYRTLMTGKWHLGWKREGSPTARGFQRFYGTPGYVDSYFTIVRRTDVYLDDTLLMGPTESPVNHLHPDQTWYTTDVYTDYALYFIDEALRHDSPFFAYVAYNAPHFPLHAHESDIAKYRGRYRGGWNRVRKERFARMRELGILPPHWELSPRDSPAWESLSTAEREQAEFRMATYAAIVDRLDQNVGRLIEDLEERGILDDTLVLFLSDNGGSSERGLLGLQSDENLAGDYRRWQRAGGWTSSYGQGWANVSNTPFRRYKRYNHEGGVSAPLIVRWPRAVEQTGSLNRQVAHIIDLMPTLLDAADAEHPAVVDGVATQPLEGRSLLPALRGETFERGPIHWEHEGNRAVRDGRWKLVGVREGEWELYDMERDRTELNDRSGDESETAARLRRLWEDWASRVRAEPYEEVDPRLKR